MKKGIADKDFVWVKVPTSAVVSYPAKKEVIPLPRMNEAKITEIKKLVIIALASDDRLMETLVLKGGNAMMIGYDLGTRASFDLDFSIEGDFYEELEAVRSRIEATLVKTLRENGYTVFDFTFRLKPSNVHPDLQDFWGGYEVLFKTIETEKYHRFENDIEALRRNAIPVNPDHSPKFGIDISKFEYVGQKVAKEVDGYTVFVYAPEIIVLEKLRAICQQHPDYAAIVKAKTERVRTRDFYDIHTLFECFHINETDPAFLDNLRHVFEAKKVPLDYLKKMREMKELHRQDFPSLQATVSPMERAEMKGFDFYFDFVLSKFENILD